MDNVFIIQEEYAKTIDGIMVKTIMDRYAAWYLDKYEIGEEYSLLPRETAVPVGNLLFVQKFLEQKMQPLEVPEELRKYIQRDEYFICKGKDINDCYKNELFFFKDADTLKSWNNALNPWDLNLKPETNYVVTSRVEFLSEYRVFVHDKEILGCQNYLGDPMSFPDSEYIKDIISEYEGPKAYTLDIGIWEKDGKSVTDIIEIHPFVSCGLYGFYDREIIPMLKDGFDWYRGLNK